MNEESRKANYNNDEIDLRELFAAIGRFFNRIGRSFLNLIVSIKNASKKYVLIILISGLLGLLGGSSVKFLFDPYYESSMLLRSVHLNLELMENAVDKLDQLSFERSHDELARVLNINEDKAKQIRSFSVEAFVSEEQIIELETLKESLKSDIKDEKKLELLMEQVKMEKQDIFKITVQTYDAVLLNDFTEPLSLYLKNKPYVQKRLEIENKNRLSKKNKIARDRQKLDSLKAVLFQNISKFSDKRREGSNNVILSESFFVNPLSVFKEDLDLLEQEQEIDEELYLNPDFEVIDEFTQYTRPASPGLIENAFYGLLYGLGVAYLIIFLLSFNTYLKDFEAKR
ncbi:MAG: hypothetical protein AAF363_11825 [Bacteroidota bacterium]